jgi:hypothetical protein
VQRSREEGIYKSRKVMGIRRKVVQDFFLTEKSVCVVSVREYKQIF